MSRKYNPAWPDTAAARRERQAKRRSRLDTLAKTIGYESWEKLATAALKGDVVISRRN